VDGPVVVVDGIAVAVGAAVVVAVDDGAIVVVVADGAAALAAGDVDVGSSRSLGLGTGNTGGSKALAR
jgi:hypothetical protein